MSKWNLGKGYKPAAGKSGIGKGKGIAIGTEQKEYEWQIPAFSIQPPKKEPAINWEKVEKDTIRRLAPKGQHIKEIRRILRKVKGQYISVHQLVNLISPHRADGGACLRAIMGKDLESFRNITRRVYETMTKDVSDVLVNEQLQMVQYYQERHDHLTEKMMRAVNEIYDMVPEFDFEKYLANKEKYLNAILPLPAEIQRDDADIEMQKRQEAYHRLQWLRSEGERMGEENKRLQRRLQELKQEQQMEQNRAAEMAAEAETKRQELVEEEAQIKDK